MTDSNTSTNTQSSVIGVSDLIVKIDQGVMNIHFNRAAKKNAITCDMYQAMADAVKHAQSRADVKVILFTGDENCFTAGNDLKDFLDVEFTESSPVVQLIEQLAANTKPTVAAVNGAAIGIGTTLLLHCDFVYANQKSIFAVPFVNLALCPEAASSLLLPQLIGLRKANELLLLGDKLNAEQALQYGLINGVDEILAENLATKTVEKLLAMPTQSLMETRRLMRMSSEALIANVMQTEVQSFKAALKTDAAKEAFSAFFERRKPDFSRLN
jgi:enoyl-CoA hydratase/carnithine racemase